MGRIQGQAAGYGTALLAIAAAVGLRWLLDPVLGEHLPLVTLFAAVAVAQWYGGYRVALLATLVGYLACDWLFIAPRGSIGIDNLRALVGLLAYLLTCGLLIAFGEAWRDARERLREQHTQLQRSERELADFFDNAAVGLHWVGPDGTILRANRAELDMLGYAPEEYIGRNIAEFHADAPVIDEILTRLCHGETLTRFPARLRCRDGSLREVLVSSNVLFEDGRFVHTRCFTIDVTDQKQAERALRESEQRFRELANNIDQLVWTSDGNGRCTWSNRRVEEFAGAGFEMLRGEGWMKLVHPEHVERVVQGISRASREGASAWEDTFPMRGRDGRYRWFLTRAVPIRDADGHIVRWFGTNTDITGQRELEQALREADRRKDAFLATLAHELRNPLAPVRNALESIKREGSAPGPGRTAAALATLDRQVAVMARLIEDLLDVSRIGRDHLELRRCDTPLSAVVEQAVEAARPLADALGHHLEIRMPERPLWLHADPVRLAQVFGNLLNNACKFTPRGGRIVLAARSDGAEVVVSVRDNGIGIAPSMRERIFELFEQVDQGHGRRHGGLGIGLTLVRRLVTMHGGRIEVHSEGHGGGSEFRVRLPLLEREPRPEAAGALAKASTPRTVLVVDDNEDGARSMGVLLELCGHRVHLAFAGEEALAVAGRVRPDVVLLDIGMPGMDGFEVCRRLREAHWGRELAVVALTGWGEARDERHALDAGFDAHLVKPADADALLALIEELIASRAAKPAPAG